MKKKTGTKKTEAAGQKLYAVLCEKGYSYEIYSVWAKSPSEACAKVERHLKATDIARYYNGFKFTAEDISQDFTLIEVH